MPATSGSLASKKCRCGARRHTAARRCAKCQARACYQRSKYYQKAAQRRANKFRSIRNQRKDMPS